MEERRRKEAKKGEGKEEKRKGGREKEGEGKEREGGEGRMGERERESLISAGIHFDEHKLS